MNYCLLCETADNAFTLGVGGLIFFNAGVLGKTAADGCFLTHLYCGFRCEDVVDGMEAGLV